MKKFKLILLLIALFLMSTVSNAAAPEKIAIGLKYASSAVSSAAFNANGLIVSNDETNIMLKSDTSFTAKPITIYVSNEDYLSISQDGIKKDDTYFPYSTDLKVFKSANLQAINTNKIPNAVGIYDSKNNLIFATSTNNLYFYSSTFSPVEIFAKKYRGGLKFINNSSKLTVINYLNIEEYLLGVVPREMSASWHMEALKAQAIAARSFAYSNYEKYMYSYGFNLTSDTKSQAYEGVNIEQERSTKAVMETKGIVGYYGGKVAQLIYNASSGGKTESAKNVWGGDIPYLIAKTDPYSTNNPYQNWSFKMTSTEIENVLRANGKNIGKLITIRIDEVSPSGYVLKITYVGTNSSVTYTKDSIRASLGYSKLKSLNFKVGISGSSASIGNFASGNKDPNFKKLDEFIDSKTTKVASTNSYTNFQTTYIFTGNGFGHGVGMSQYGAKTMAESGYNYQTILSFYYPNVTLGQIQ